MLYASHRIKKEEKKKNSRRTTEMLMLRIALNIGVGAVS
jgi:hypothetical protein